MRFCILLFLATIAPSAFAEWSKANENTEIVVYLDLATIRKDGQFRRVWELQDLKKRDPYGEKSRRLYEEFDCKDGRFRTLSISSHYQSMAGGKVLAQVDSPSQWDYVPPGTIIKSILDFVCSQ